MARSTEPGGNAFGFTAPEPLASLICGLTPTGACVVFADHG
jgi:hypothetical protein